MLSVFIKVNFDEMGSGNFGYETGLVWHISLFYLESRRSREGKRRRKKALSMFQNDPPTTVFLLSIRAGAVGINLTQANHVFLLDACTNRIEAKARQRRSRSHTEKPCS